MSDRGDVNIRAGAQMREYMAIVDRIASDDPGRILDWGAGRGQNSSLLREAGLDIASYDFRADAPEVGTEIATGFPGVEITVSGDSRRLPFEDEEFGAVLSCGVLEHVEDPDDSLEELRRILRPGGMLYVYKLPNRLSYLEWIARRLGMYYHGIDPFDRLYTLDSAREIVAAHGFEIESSRYANMLPLTAAPGTRGIGAPVWALNRALDRVPGLNRLATNVELIATKSAAVKV